MDKNVAAGAEKTTKKTRLPWLCWAASDNAVLCHSSRDQPQHHHFCFCIVTEKQNGQLLRWLIHIYWKTLGSHTREALNWPGAKSTQEKPVLPTIC